MAFRHNHRLRLLASRGRVSLLSQFAFCCCSRGSGSGCKAHKQPQQLADRQTDRLPQHDHAVITVRTKKGKHTVRSDQRNERKCSTLVYDLKLSLSTYFY